MKRLFGSACVIMALASLCAGCSGGSVVLSRGTPIVVATASPTPTVVATATPSPEPTATPTVAPTASPTPVVTATPTPSGPAGTLAVSPTSLNFTNVGAASAQSFTASQQNVPPGNLTAASSNASVATVARGSTAGSFTVTPVAAGTTTIVVTGSGGMTASVSITVTTTPTTIMKESRP